MRRLFAPRPQAEEDALRVALRHAQALDPAGVAARPVAECLRLQRALGCEASALRCATVMLRALTPRSGAGYGAAPTQFVVADEVGLRGSTASRVTSRTYMATPRGLLEFKHFFASHVETAAGTPCSATAVRALITELIGAEDAKRTVSKVRDSLRIPSVEGGGCRTVPSRCADPADRGAAARPTAARRPARTRPRRPRRSGRTRAAG